MTRVPRTSRPDGYFHVYAHAIYGQLIYQDDEDRRTFLELLRLCERRYKWTCLAYTLMSTHYHLVLRSTQRALSDGLQLLNGRYAQSFNRRHGRFGHVFAGRSGSRAIEREEYLYDACSYVVLNPVRAGLCGRVDDWPWSFSRFGLAA